MASISHQLLHDFSTSRLIRPAKLCHGLQHNCKDQQIRLFWAHLPYFLLFFSFKSILSSPTGCVQAAVLKPHCKRSSTKALTLPLATAGGLSPAFRGRSLQPRRDHTALVPTPPRGHANCPLQLHPPKALPERLPAPSARKRCPSQNENLVQVVPLLFLSLPNDS